MGIERGSGEFSFVDVLDRVLDKGIVIEGWMRISLMGLDLVTVRGCAVVASIETYKKHSEGSLPKGRHSPPWLYDLLEGLSDRPSSRRP